MFPILESGYTLGRLLDGTKCQPLLDMGASKSFMSKSFYMQCKSLHTFPKFASTTQRIQVRNGQCVSVLFIIPVIVNIHGHRFNIYTLVSEIHENVDLVLGIKNVFELEGVINSRDCCFEFFELISANLSWEGNNIETRWAEVSESQSLIYRWNFRVGDNENYIWRYL